MTFFKVMQNITFILQKNLDSFVTIYEWLNPHADIDLLRHNGSELEREIHIDAFMQDIVIRGRGFDSPEIRTKVSINVTSVLKLSIILSLERVGGPTKIFGAPNQPHLHDGSPCWTIVKVFM